MREILHAFVILQGSFYPSPLLAMVRISDRSNPGVCRGCTSRRRATVRSAFIAWGSSSDAVCLMLSPIPHPAIDLKRTCNLTPNHNSVGHCMQVSYELYPVVTHTSGPKMHWLVRAVLEVAGLGQPLLFCLKGQASQLRNHPTSFDSTMFFAVDLK